MADGTTIHQWQFHGGDSQKWIFDHVGDGYYTIKTAYDSRDYYLSIENDSTAEEAPVVLRNIMTSGGLVSNGMLWQISTTTSGAYRLTPKTGNWCLATSATSSTNGNILYQDWYAGQNQSYRDEWGIIPELTMALYGIPDEDGSHDHSSALSSIIGMGGWSSYTFLTRDVSAYELKLGLDVREIYISRSHGNYIYYSGGTTVARTGILLNDIPPSGTNDVWLWSHYDSYISSNSSYMFETEDYSNLSIALFVACYTGKGGDGARNLPTRAVELGAEVAIGFKVSINCGATTTWTTAFWEAMLNGATVNLAAEQACNATQGSIAIGDVTICGNQFYRLATQ